MIVNNTFKNLTRSLQKGKKFSTVCSNLGLSKFGIHKPSVIHHNLSYDELFKHEQKNKEGKEPQKRGKLDSISNTRKLPGKRKTERKVSHK